MRSDDDRIFYDDENRCVEACYHNFGIPIERIYI